MTDWSNLSSVAVPSITTGNVFNVAQYYGQPCCGLYGGSNIPIAWNKSSNASVNVPSAGYYSDPGPRLNSFGIGISQAINAASAKTQNNMANVTIQPLLSNISSTANNSYYGTMTLNYRGLGLPSMIWE